MAEWIIGGIIAGYCLFLIIRRIRKIRRGETCSCGECSCKDCPSKNIKKENK